MTVKNSLLPVFLFSALLAFAEDIPVNPHKAPLYWSVYENNFVKEQQGVTDNYISESEWLANIEWVDKNLKSFGYKMICVDGWGDDSEFNAYGYRTKHSRHWQHTYGWWAAELAKRGMALGIYDNPLWINRAAANAGYKIKGTDIPIANLIDNSETSAFGFTWVQVDRPGAEEYVKGCIQHYADMGVRYLRVDFLSWYETGTDYNMGIVGRTDRPRTHYETALRWMREECDRHGILLSLVMPHLKNDAELELKYGNMIRINEDTAEGGWFRFSDNARGVWKDNWSQLKNPFDGFIYWSQLSGRNKMILDGDFIRLNTFANDEERKAVISLHLMAGGPVSIADQYHTIGSSLWIYQNAELLALNEDGFVGQPLSNSLTDNNRNQIWKGQMSNGDWIVGLFNRESTPQTRVVNFPSELGISSGYVRDLWEHTDLGSKNLLAVSIPSRSCKIYRISLFPNSISSKHLNDISFYPKGNNQFMIQNAENANLKVFNLQGWPIYTNSLLSDKEIMDFQMLSGGICIVRLQKEEIYKTFKCFIR